MSLPSPLAQEEDSAESLDEDGGGLFGALRDFFDDE